MDRATYERVAAGLAGEKPSPAPADGRPSKSATKTELVDYLAANGVTFDADDVPTVEGLWAVIGEL